MTTALRPVYFEFFPNFSSAELLQRAQNLPPHVATLLVPGNIGRLEDALGKPVLSASFPKFAFHRQAELLGDVLAHVGIPPALVEAVTATPRHLFVPAADRHNSYLNRSIPLGDGSCLSPPGMVSLMCRSLLAVVGSPATCLEIGSGSGYHAAVVRRATGAEVFGVEIDARIAEFGQECLARSGTSGVHIMPGTLEQHGAQLPMMSAVYHALARRRPLFTEIGGVLTDGGVYQCVRPLTIAEFAAAGPYVTRCFPVHRSYLNGRWYDHFAVMATYRKTGGSGFSEMDRLYDVRFVPWRHHLIGQA